MDKERTSGIKREKERERERKKERKKVGRESGIKRERMG